MYISGRTPALDDELAGFGSFLKGAVRGVGRAAQNVGRGAVAVGRVGGGLALNFAPPGVKFAIDKANDIRDALRAPPAPVQLPATVDFTPDSPAEDEASSVDVDDAATDELGDWLGATSARRKKKAPARRRGPARARATVKRVTVTRAKVKAKPVRRARPKARKAVARKPARRARPVKRNAVAKRRRPIVRRPTPKTVKAAKRRAVVKKAAPIARRVVKAKRPMRRHKVTPADVAEGLEQAQDDASNGVARVAVREGDETPGVEAARGVFVAPGHPAAPDVSAQSDSDDEDESDNDDGTASRTPMARKARVARRIVEAGASVHRGGDSLATRVRALSKKASALGEKAGAIAAAGDSVGAGRVAELARRVQGAAAEAAARGEGAADDINDAGASIEGATDGAVVGAGIGGAVAALKRHAVPLALVGGALLLYANHGSSARRSARRRPHSVRRADSRRRR